MIGNFAGFMFAASCDIAFPAGRKQRCPEGLRRWHGGQRHAYSNPSRNHYFHKEFILDRNGRWRGA
jgi:hypothetical protein